MFYEEIIAILRSNPAVAGSVGTYKNAPAIFSEHAPEEATKEDGPAYIVVNIKTSAESDKVISVSNLFIDYFDYNKSRVVCNQYALDVMDLLDDTLLRTKQVNVLRITWMDDGYIENKADPRTIHFNSTFSCRGGRSGWGNRTKTK